MQVQTADVEREAGAPYLCVCDKKNYEEMYCSCSCNRKLLFTQNLLDNIGGAEIGHGKLIGRGLLIKHFL